MMKCIINGQLILPTEVVSGMAIIFDEKIEKIVPESEVDLSAYEVIDAEGKWVDIQKYTKPENILTGEIGTLGGVRFVQSTESKVFYGQDLSPEARNLTVTAYNNESAGGAVTAGIADDHSATVKEAVTNELLGRRVYYKEKTGEFHCMTVVGVNTNTKTLYFSNGEGITFVNGDMLGDAMFYGRGAGPLPTGSAVCGDILSIMKSKF